MGADHELIYHSVVAMAQTDNGAPAAQVSDSKRTVWVDVRKVEFLFGSGEAVRHPEPEVGRSVEVSKHEKR